MIRLLLFNILFAVQLIWSADFNESRKQAQEAHKLILVNFSGSDWCGPCIRLRKEILESSEFESYAQKKLILVRADFPRQKKNQLSKEQERKNEALADMYNPEGKFPYTVLVDENGKVLKHWDGFPDLSPEQFVSQIKLVDDARQ
ncbi:thioredoxin family protein [Arcticibacter tournemirensis]|uniref:Thioredoxin family protein n=1 Tax=Arcticibacter tournemirensis TaxID=699437 RepID=A0A4Q0MBG1_9SPHI|nr:thioredoxin family protein [Arcticibacter tournemirensis]RXF70648.1 thioredoxin family protein [Arcticibacter tournemirensis]